MNRHSSSIPTLVIVLGILTIAALQTQSLRANIADHVDEGELIHYAIGFFGGDLDPRWYGYGTLPMYLLAGVFFATGSVIVALGVFDTFDQYTQQIFHNGHFYILSRYFISILSVTAVFVFAVIARNNKTPPVLIFGYIAIAITSKDALFYSDYVRVDSILSLLVAISLYLYFKRENKLSVYALALVTAAAIATKLSTLPLTAFLALALFTRYRKGQIRASDVLAISALFIAGLYIYQPHTNYLEVFRAISERATEGHVFWFKPQYGTVWERFSALVYILDSHLTTPLLLLPFGLVFSPSLLKRMWPALMLALLLLLPYVFSPEITSYWFLALISLWRLLALLGAAAVFWKIASITPEMPYKSVVSNLVVFALVLVTLTPNLDHYFKVLQRLKIRPFSNRELAEDWLRRNVLFKQPIVIDALRGFGMPRVFDPADIDGAKRISRVFLFNRSGNNYLNRIFLEYLIDEYIPLYTRNLRYNKLKSIRILVPDHSNGDIAIKDLSVCKRRRNTCTRLRPVSISNGVTIADDTYWDVEVSLGAASDVITITGIDIPAIGDRELRFKLVSQGNSYGRVMFDYGNGFSPEDSYEYKTNTDFQIPIFSAQEEHMVKKQSPVDVRIKKNADGLNGKYVVISRNNMQAFLNRDPKALTKQMSEQLATIQNYYRFILKNKLVAQFNKGTGQKYEVYQIGG